MPDRWEHDIQHLSQQEILTAVKCERWQTVRRGMKGTTTTEKLKTCEWWLTNGCSECCDKHRRSVQVDNYINALKRGGQLDLEGNVVR